MNWDETEALRQQLVVMRGRAEEAERRMRAAEYSVGQLSPDTLKAQVAAAEERVEAMSRTLRSAEARWEHERKVLEAQLRETKDKAIEADQRAAEASRTAAKAIEARAPRAKGVAGVASAVVDALDEFAEREEGKHE